MERDNLERKSSPTNARTLPERVKVAAVIESRYPPGERPVLWNERRSGFERIRTTDGREMVLASSGGQSTPAPGWELLLTKRIDGEPGPAYAWTLYGISKL